MKEKKLHTVELTGREITDLIYVIRPSAIRDEHKEVQERLLAIRGKLIKVVNPYA